MASPVDAARLATNGPTAADPAVVNLPATIDAGDTLVMLFRANNVSPGSATSGWTNLFSANLVGTEVSDDTMIIMWRKADGTEDGGTVSVDLSASGKFAAIVWKITGAADPTVTPPEISAHVVGSSTTPDPGTVTPTGGSKDYLFLWLGGWEGEQTSPPAGNPTNYSNPSGADSGTGGAAPSNCRVAGASRQLTASSEDPGSWTISVTETWSAWTLAVHPGVQATSLLLPNRSQSRIVRCR